MDFCLYMLRRKIMHVVLRASAATPGGEWTIGRQSKSRQNTCSPCLPDTPSERTPCAWRIAGAPVAFPPRGWHFLLVFIYFYFIFLPPGVIPARSCGSSSPTYTTRSWWPGSRGDADSFWSNPRITEGRASRQVRGVRKDPRSSGRRRSSRTRTQTSHTRPTDMQLM